jgi:type IV secretory pathway TraG/TraD family ATPase VirD4
MMPPFDESRREWTVRNWVKERKGWLFITSTPKTLDALRPLQSLWLDMLILALQNDSDDESRRTPVWLIIDELASLHVLPQLITALTKQRKSGNPIVTGFQNMAQLKGLYGQSDADTITSQAFSNFILRTREPNAAEHLSGLIGKAQLERLRESQPSRLFEARQGTYNTERVMEPVVMASELQTLPNLNGYFVQKASIVPIRFKPTSKRIVSPGLIPPASAPARPLPPQPPAPAKTQAVVPVANKTAKDIVLEEIQNSQSRKPC